MFMISNDIINEIIINKSRFICILKTVYSTSDFNNLLCDIKTKYKDATHYCYAYIIDSNIKCSDDGEPSKTAGSPILNVLESNKLNYIACIVIRYFGGIKLGAGGLVRAYTKSVTSALDKIVIKESIKGYEIVIKFDYNKIKEIDYLLNNCKIIDKKFDDTIKYSFLITENAYENIKSSLNSNVISLDIIKEKFI